MPPVQPQPYQKLLIKSFQTLGNSLVWVNSARALKHTRHVQARHRLN